MTIEKLLDWNYCINDNYYIRKAISLDSPLRDYIHIDKNLKDCTIENAIWILKNTTLGLYDKILAYHNVIAVDFEYKTATQLNILNNNHAEFILYCLQCKNVILSKQIYPQSKTIMIDDESVFMNINKKCSKTILCNLCTNIYFEHFKWDEYNIDGVYIRKKISIKRSLATLLQQSCISLNNNKNIRDKDVALTHIRNISNRDTNFLWNADISLIRSNVIAINTKRRYLLILEVLEPYRVRFDYYFLACGHYIKGEEIMSIGGHKMNPYQIRQAIKELKCTECKYIFKENIIKITWLGMASMFLYIAYLELCAMFK